MNHFQKSNFLNLQKNWQEFEPKGKIVVLYGGFTEREISLQSGREVLTSLKNKQTDHSSIDVIGFDWNETNPIHNLIALNPDMVFIALHGGNGENGTIQGLLQSYGICYTGSGVLASSLSMHKDVSKQIWLKHHLPCPDYILISDEQMKEFEKEKNSLDKTIIKKLSIPFVIKPVASGSSLGVSLVRDIKDFPKAVQLARKHSKVHHMVMAEKYISGKEVTVGFLFDIPLSIVAIEVENPFYDYDAKYISHQTKLISPAPLSKKIADKIIHLSNKAYHSLKMSGWGRVDLMMDDKHNLFLLEANVVPGLTSHSLVPASAKSQGINFDALVWNILKTAHTPR